MLIWMKSAAFAVLQSYVRAERARIIALNPPVAALVQP